MKANTKVAAYNSKVAGSGGCLYLNFSELRSKLGNRARSSIYLDVKNGRLPPPIKLGGRLYWVDADVDAHMRGGATEAA